MGKTDKFSPFAVNGKTAKNRFIRSATNSHLCNTDGTVSDAEIEMYDTLGRGDVGTVITGHLSATPGMGYRADIVQPSIGRDEYIPGLRSIADKIHRYGALAIAQISVAGPKGLTPFDFNELSTAEMEQIRDWFIECAQLSRRCR